MGVATGAACAERDTPSSLASTVAELNVSAETAVGSTARVPAPYGQEAPAVAPAAGGYLVAWSDNRRAYQDESLWRIMVAQLDASGEEVLGGRPVTTSRAHNPAIAANPSGALVAYQGFNGSGLMAQRLSLDGTPVDGVELTLSPGGTGPQIAADGNGGYLVAWSASSAVEAATVSASGKVGATLSLGTSDVYGAPRVAWTGSQFVVTWISGYSVLAARVSAGGTLVDSPAKSVVPPTDYLECPEVASTADGALQVLWHRHTTSPPLMRVEGVRVSKDLVPQGGVGTVSKAVAGSATCPAASWDGSSFVAAWNQDDGTALQMRGARVGSSGPIDAADLVLADPPGGAGAFRRRAHAVGCRPASGGCLVAWLDSRVPATKSDIYGGVLTAGKLSPVGGGPIAAVAVPQRAPVLARGVSTTLVAWEDARSGDASPSSDDAWDVYAAVLRADGKAVGADLALGVAQLAQGHAAAAFDGTGYVVLWEDSRKASSNLSDIYLARVSETGQSAGGAPVLQSAAREAAPSIAAGTGGALVAWIEGSSATGRVMAATLANGASTLGASFPLASTGAGSTVRVASGEGTYLVVWDSFPSGTATRYILAARLDASGKLLDSSPMTVGVGDVSRPSVAFGAGKFVVTWSTNTGILAARVGPDGVVEDDPGLVVPTGGGGVNSTVPADVAFNGQGFLVAWHERAAPGATGDSLQMNLLGSTLDPVTGKFSARLDVETTKTESRGVRLASGDGSVLAVYDRWTLSAPYGDRRAFLVQVGDLGTGGAGGAGG
ncbi:MAG: hypothetical protein IT307_14420, partial [Chloroflexi bacterium]|nr:hypothetical protein [Chloroflexota bacterium]